MSAQLVPINSGSAPAIPILRPVVLVGRHLECDFRIDVPQVSRRHCCLAMAYDRLVIRDLGSRNGVRVNGRLVEEVQLRPGDEVAIAHFIYRLEWTKPASPTPSKPTPRPSAAAAMPDPPPIIDLDDDFVPLSE
jgi:pSer/pThr/pTyr-binding forkhead associated (FHA) protein